MTIVIARQFDNVSVVVSDTMVSDRNARRTDDIPGTLKTLVTGMAMSISYAGDVEWASLNIRKAIGVGASSDQAIETLRLATVDDRCEYIVATHDREQALYKIWCGHVSGKLQECFIGSPAAYQAFLTYETEARANRVIREWTPEAQFIFQTDWRGFLTPIDTPLPADVGGLAVCQLCYPKGYCYANMAGAVDWTNINLAEIATPEQLKAREENRRSGLTAFQYQVNGIARGASVLGTYFTQGEVGFISIGVSR